VRFAPNAAILDADDIAHQLALPVITNAVDLSFPVIFNSLLGATELKVIRSQTGVLGDPRQHLWADLFTLVKGKHEVRPAGPAQRSM